ncbi:structural maintenance of chromosome 1 [Nematocida parisii]|nr:structural maintenance of chromosome 1 [Nematocida parisii]KAI5126467.1 structural maintenance of chromosome 1 [Nematocida parisii]KAI5140708.1 structural maintenance of chromosome 1 [Nematocida parisii]
MAILNMKILSFKTYEKVESVPFSPFTCIVGPNGAGKSNLIDALLFVFGASPQEIRGSIPARDCMPPTRVELAFRDKNGVIINLKREMANDSSSFYIDDVKVSFIEYSSYLESQNISTVHRNFLISQNEALIKSPKELSKFIEKISGSYAHKEEYKLLKEQKEQFAKEYQELMERKRAAEVSTKAYEEVSEMHARHRLLMARKRVLASSKIKKKKAQIRETRQGLVGRLLSIEEKGNSTELRELHKEMAHIQTQLIKCRAIKSSMQHRIDLKGEEEAEIVKSNEVRAQGIVKIKEQIAEAAAQIEDCLWHLKNTEDIASAHPGWNEKYQREALIQTLSQIQRVEDSKSILQMKIHVNEIKRELKELIQKEKEQKDMDHQEVMSNRLAHLNQALLETLKELSCRMSRSKDVEYNSRLGYLIGRIKESIPQVVGRVCDLVACTEERYQTAINALIHSKRNIIIIEQEKHAQPILNGLAQSGAGRVTILPLNRLNSYGGAGRPDKENISNQQTRLDSLPAGYIRCRDVIKITKDIKYEENVLIDYICGRALIYLGEGSPTYAAEKVITLDGIIISQDGSVRKIASRGDESAIKELEEKRDALLTDIKAESGAQKSAQAEKRIYVKSEQVIELEKRCEEAERYLKETEAEIKGQIDEIVAKSQIPYKIIQHAKEEGVIDSSSANKKTAQIKKKEESWRNRLNDLRQALNKLEKVPVRVAEEMDESTEALNKEILELEAKLLEVSKRIEPSSEIELKMIKEQIVVLDDEIEEIEQYMAEEGITEEAIQEAPSSMEEEDLEKLEREITSVSSFLSKKGVVAETHQIYAQLERETEEKKNVLAEVTRQFQKVRKERAALFLNVFDKINTLINQHYARLTENPSGHVRAHLGLENSLEPYLAGVQIFVMPTGKTFREAKYLSGGEKTMVALALLLSINSIYPSLFYVFDELDAALDKDKITCLRESLQEINAQFVAVTHRIELFETADTLIGVARPPQGHSQVFSLKL